MAERLSSAADASRELLQRRLKTLLFVLMLLTIVGLTVNLVQYFLVPASHSSHPRLVLTGLGLGLAIATACWLVLRAPRSLATSQAIDTGLALLFGVAYAAWVFLLSGRVDDLYFAIQLSGLFLLARALFVPSSTRRTALVSIAWALPVFGSAVAVAAIYPERLTMPAASFVINMIFQCGLPVILAAVGSLVINGLRRDVREARRLGQYTLGDKIGEGGMGAVYHARHALLRRPTAIKLLPPEKSGAASIRRFEREVQLTAQLTDPHVVAVFDYGRSNDGTFYYAMEFLDGVDLQTLVEDFGPQPAARVVHILRQACDALEEAHQRGLIHRDIKPANLILCRRGMSGDWVKVLDFGLVKDMERDDGDTTVGTIQGTPKYISPEAIADPDSVSPQSDIYALGAVGYFLITGTDVFAGNTVVEVCSKHLHEPPEPPSTRTDRPIPKELEELLLACLSKSPSSRPTSALELGKALSHIAIEPAWGQDEIATWWAGFQRADSRLPIQRRSDLSVVVDLDNRG